MHRNLIPEKEAAYQTLRKEKREALINTATGFLETGFHMELNKILKYYGESLSPEEKDALRYLLYESTQPVIKQFEILLQKKHK